MRRPLLAVVAIVLVALAVGSCAVNGLHAPVQPPLDVAEQDLLASSQETDARRPPADTPPSPVDGGELVGWDQNPLGRRWTWRVPKGLVEAATEVLGEVEGDGMELHHAGYLDLLGNVWACLATSEGWVGAFIVQEEVEEGYAGGSQARGSACLVTVVRLGEGEMGSAEGEGS